MHQILSIPGKFRRCRALALVALLFMLGLQLQEAVHQHGMDEGVIECLLCKVQTGASLPGTAQASAVPGPAVSPPAFRPEHTATPFSNAPRARGPPAHS